MLSVGKFQGRGGGHGAWKVSEPHNMWQVKEVQVLSRCGPHDEFKAGSFQDAFKEKR